MTPEPKKWLAETGYPQQVWPYCHECRAYGVLVQFASMSDGKKRWFCTRHSTLDISRLLLDLDRPLIVDIVDAKEGPWAS